MSQTDPTPPSLPAPVEDESLVALEDPEDDWSPPAAVPGWSDRYEPYSLLALVMAVLGLIPLTWPVPILSLAAVAFALVGLHHCQLDATRPNRWMAVVALALGLLTLAAVVVLTSLKDVQLLPFWTQE